MNFMVKKGNQAPLANIDAALWRKGPTAIHRIMALDASSYMYAFDRRASLDLRLIFPTE